MLVCNCLEVLVILALRLLFIRDNKRKEAARAELKAQAETQHDDHEGEVDLKGGVLPTKNSTAFADLTDKENIK